MELYSLARGKASKIGVTVAYRAYLQNVEQARFGKVSSNGATCWACYVSA